MQQRVLDNVEPLDLDENKKKPSFEQMLGELQEGYKLSLWRLKPSWCKSHLETTEIALDGDKKFNLDLDEIKETWGGGQIQIKILDNQGVFVGAKSVYLHGPPREHGVRLYSPSELDRQEQMKLEEMRLQSKKNEQDTKMMDFMIAMATNNNNNNNNDLIKIMFEQMTKNKSIDGQPSLLGQMSEMMQAMNMFKEQFGGEKNEEKNDNDISGMMTSFMQLLAAKNNQPKPINPPHMYRQPQPQPHPQLHPQPHLKHERKHEINNEKDIESLQNLDNDDIIENDDENDIVDALINLQDDDLANVICEMLGSISEERQMKIFQKVDNEIEKYDSGQKDKNSR